MIFSTPNLTERSMVSTVLPWEFAPSETLTAQLRKDKVERQLWYKSAHVKHNFYSGIEAANPNARVSKENPPRLIHALVADFDLPIPEARVNEGIKAMKIAPSWVERSLGGNIRLVWLLAKPIHVDSFDFCVFALKAAVKWLGLGMLPGLDEPAFSDPARLYCNGCEWRTVNNSCGSPLGSIGEAELQAFYVKCGKEFRFKPTDATGAIPLDEVEKAIKEKYPHFSWPADFALDSQGPSFWIPESTTPMSAIVKPDGMFSFSGHAERPFYSWSQILSPEWVQQYLTKTISAATAEIYWDSKRFWRKIQGQFCSLDSPELQNYFKVTCKMSPKPAADGLSLIDTALEHIYNSGRIVGAAPHLFRPSGILEFQGRRILNTYIHRVMSPAPEMTVWGPEGGFPFLSRHFEALFDPPEQRFAFLAWWKAYYTSAYTMTPMPGQNTFFMGGVGVGKTMTSHAIIGRSVGGAIDASSFLLGNEPFNSELLEVPLWCSDDETMGESAQTQAVFSAMLKKTAANSSFHYKKKFEVGAATEWMGRIIVTTNLDYISSRALGPMDNSSLDKTNVFRCANEGKLVFPNRHVLSGIIDRELPYLLRWLLQWDPTTEGVKTDVRYGYKAHHEPGLLEQAHQGSKAAPFKELLYEALFDYFRGNLEATAWRGSLTQLSRLLISDPRNESIIRSLRLEQTQRYLEMIQRDGSLRCSVETGPLKTRVWIFERFGDAPPAPPAPIAASPIINIFNK